MKEKFNNHIKLDGMWKLYYEDNYICKTFEPTTIAELDKLGFKCIDGSVPGNFELDFEREGLLPELTVGLNMLKVQELENKHLWYATNFENPFVDAERCLLLFEGVDTFADIYLNGKKIGSCDNMLIPHQFSVPNICVGKNELVVHIKPTEIEARKYQIEADSTVHGPYNGSSITVRRAPHTYGWDIMPRAISGGLWRSVKLVCLPEEYIDEFYIYTAVLRPNRAVIFANYQFCLTGDFIREYRVEIDGTCKDSHFHESYNLWQASGRFGFYVDSPMLWWTKDMGEPNLYDVTIKLYHLDELVAVENRTLGIREVELKRTSVIDENGNGEFLFMLNKEKMFVRGTNWVPLDAFHSRDKSRLPNALKLLDEMGCNMVRCWGGNVYEDDDFYTFCDQNGIAVWQDFSMACAVYPQDERISEMFKIESESVIRSLRQHPSIFLYAGDNECDLAHKWSATRLNPSDNRITRKVFREAIEKLDPVRIPTYLPSSPYVDDVANKTDLPTPEDHLWGERPYYKAPYYTEAKTKFSSEIGYFGCPEPDSMKKFFTPENIWPWSTNNPEWIFYAMNPEVVGNQENGYIPQKIAQQIESLFEKAPDNLGDYTLASQITQSEAMKFFVETFRINKWDKTGIMFWNLLDGWPQTSNGFVDYYFKKKIAFESVRRSFLPVCISCSEPKDGIIELIGMNEYLSNKNIDYRVIDMLNDTVICTGNFTLSPSSASTLTQFDFDGKQRCYRLEWKVDGKEHTNHYLAGEPKFDFNTVVGYYEKLGLVDRKKFK